MKALLRVNPQTGTSLSLKERTERVFAYLIPILSAVFLLVVERNATVRKHSWQALRVFVPLFIVWALLSGLAGLIAPIWVIGGPLAWLIGLVAGIVGFIFLIAWILLMVLAFFSETVFVPGYRRFRRP